MIVRSMTSCLIERFRQYPFVTVTGPRQSGKTTLCRQTFPDLQYINLELPDKREFARSDPYGLLALIKEGAIIDEIQHVPEFVSYLQVFADDVGRDSLFILTGSEHFKLTESVSQSLAGRTGLLYLLPFSLAERKLSVGEETLNEILHAGFYPRIVDKKLDPCQAYAEYFSTYIDRDLRRLSQVRDLPSFEKFVRLCANQVGQIINLESICTAVGISHTAARQWLNMMEASFIVFRLQPFYANLKKRLVRKPKLYFYDVGLAAYLLGIRRLEQIAAHPMRGALFENMVVAEAMKFCFNQGYDADLSFFRDSRGLEADLLYQKANEIVAMEIKSSTSPQTRYFDSLNKIAKLKIGVVDNLVIYGGTDRQAKNSGEFIPYSDLDDVLSSFDLQHNAAAAAQSFRLPSPVREDGEILDRIYVKHIEPTFMALESALDKTVRPIFQNVRSGTRIKIGASTRKIGPPWTAKRWNQEMRESILLPGFKFSNSNVLEFVREYACSNSSFPKGMPTLNLEVIWRFDATGYVRTALFAGNEMVDQQYRVNYADLEERSSKYDRLIAAFMVQFIRHIENLKGIVEKGASAEQGFN